MDGKKSLKEYNSIGELIENIFPLSDDCFYIKWNSIDIPLSYKYDLSIIFEDLLYIFEFLKSQDNILQISFPSNTFDVAWDIKKDTDYINISSQWNVVLSHNEKVLNENSVLNIPLYLFKNELSKLLRFIYEIFDKEKDNINEELLDNILDNKPNNC